MTLYQLSDELSALDELLSEVGGDVSDAEAEAAIDAWLAQINEGVGHKIDAYCGLIQNKNARADACEAEAKRLMARASVERNATERMKARLKWFLEAQGKTKWPGTFFSPRIQANGGKRSLIVPEAWEADAAAAPERYHVVTLSLNNELIRHDIGTEFADAEGCSLAPQGTHLRLK